MMTPATSKKSSSKRPSKAPEKAEPTPAAPVVKKKAPKVLTLKDKVRRALFRAIRDEVEHATTSLLDGTYKGSSFTPDLMGKFLKIADNTRITKDEELSVIPAPPARKRGPNFKLLPKETIQKVYDLRKAGTTKPGIAKECGFKSRRTVDKAIEKFAEILGPDFKNDPAPQSLLDEEKNIRERFEKNQEAAALKLLSKQTGLSPEAIHEMLQKKYAKEAAGK